MWHSRPRLCEEMLRDPKYFYRRNLPHMQKDDRPHFVTFITHDRWVLPKHARDIVLRSCAHLDGTRMQLHAAVVMPDHVHLIFTPLRKPDTSMFRFAEILNSIKGYSAHAVNKALGRRGSVWLDESFDHALRSEEKLEEKIEYLRQNPVRRGLVTRPEDYPWLWVEGESAPPVE